MTNDEGMTKPENSDESEESFWVDNEAPHVREEPEAKPIYDLEERTARFGEAIIDFAKRIPAGPVTDRIISQLVGAGTSVGANYDEVVSFYDEIKFFPPVKYFHGEIGGHCVMSNIDILLQKFPSDLLQAIVQSNTLRQKNLGPDGWLESSGSSPSLTSDLAPH